MPRPVAFRPEMRKIVVDALYVYFIDPTARERLTVPVLPFSAIDAAGARMYRGKPLCAGTSTRDGAPVEVGGATPTPALPSSGA